MTPEFQKRMTEIRKSIQEREMRRFELERELESRAQGKVKNYERLRSRLLAIKEELYEEEMATKRRVQQLTSRIQNLKSNYDVTANVALRLKTNEGMNNFMQGLSFEKSFQLIKCSSEHKATQTDIDSIGFQNMLRLYTSQAAKHDVQLLCTNQGGSLNAIRNSPLELGLSDTAAVRGTKNTDSIIETSESESKPTQKPTATKIPYSHSEEKDASHKAAMVNIDQNTIPQRTNVSNSILSDNFNNSPKSSRSLQAKKPMNKMLDTTDNSGSEKHSAEDQPNSKSDKQAIPKQQNSLKLISFSTPKKNADTIKESDSKPKSTNISTKAEMKAQNINAVKATNAPAVVIKNADIMGVIKPKMIEAKNTDMSTTSNTTKVNLTNVPNAAGIASDLSSKSSNKVSIQTAGKTQLLTKLQSDANTKDTSNANKQLSSKISIVSAKKLVKTVNNNSPKSSTINSTLDGLNASAEKDNFFDEDIPITSTSAYKRMLGIPSKSEDNKLAKDSEINEKGDDITTIRSFDTESIDSVEAAILAATTTRNNSEKTNDENQPKTAEPQKSVTPNINKEPPPLVEVIKKAKPLHINLDPDPDSYNISAGEASDNDDDFDFS